MDILRAFIVEVSPPFRDWHPLAQELEGLLHPIFYTFKNNGWRWNTCGSISKIFNRVFRKYGQANVIFLNDKELMMKGIHSSPSDRITIAISGQYLVACLRDITKWNEFCKMLAITYTHELVHRWQQSRRGDIEDSSEYKASYYVDDPHEIDSWAHDIVNDVGFENMADFLDTNRNLSDLASKSVEYDGFSQYLSNAPDHVKRKMINRLHRAIVDIVLNSERV